MASRKYLNDLMQQFNSGVRDWPDPVDLLGIAHQHPELGEPDYAVFKQAHDRLHRRGYTNRGRHRFVSAQELAQSWSLPFNAVAAACYANFFKLRSRGERLAVKLPPA